jgi:outer membrane protein TolC
VPILTVVLLSVDFYRKQKLLGGKGLKTFIQNTCRSYRGQSLLLLASGVLFSGQLQAQFTGRSGFPQSTNPLPGPTNTMDDMEKFPGVRGAPSAFPGAVLSGPLRGFPMSMPGSLNPQSSIPLQTTPISPEFRIPLRPDISQEASRLGASSLLDRPPAFAPDGKPANSPDNASLKILNQEFLKKPEPILPESPMLPGRPMLGESQPPSGQALDLMEVLQSVDRSYPPLLAIFQELEITEGGMLSAVGGFDLSLNSAVRNYPLGYYQRWYHEYYLEQPTAYHGTKFFGGYRWGQGQYPIYYWPYRTQAGGEFAAGFEFPFLKGNRIDERRAKLWKAELDRANADPKIMRERINSINKASQAFWTWVASGRKYQIAEALLAKARERNIALARQVELGSMPEVELTDNQRILIQRESLRLTSFRRFQQASINLSLFYRDAAGFPSFPPVDRIPPSFPIRYRPSPDQLPADLETALSLRPEMRSLQIQMEKMGIDLKLAQNELLPGVNLYLYASQDVGAQPPSKNLKYLTLESSLLVDVPIQRRYAKGKIRSVEGEISQLRQQIGFTRDTITAEVQDSISQLATSYEQVELFNQSLTINEALEQSERRKYELGNSNILVVNLREQATADAEALVVDAEAEYHRAWADYRATLALDAVGATSSSAMGSNDMSGTPASERPAPVTPAENTPAASPERIIIDSPLGRPGSPFGR